jgi:hypothetical protein
MVSELTPTEVFALATPNNPIDRGREMTFYLYCMLTRDCYSQSPTWAGCGPPALAGPQMCRGMRASILDTAS